MNKNPNSATVKTPAPNFTGDVWVNPVSSGDGEATTWLEPVTDEQYSAAHRAAGV